MRSFFRSHWKVILTIVLLILLATVTVNPSAAEAGPAAASARLAERLRTHAAALAAAGHGGAAYIARTLRAEGYRVRLPAHAAGAAAPVVEAELANPVRAARPARLFVIGARYGPPPGGAADATDADSAASGDAGPAPAAANDAGVAAVLELARLLKGIHPRRGTALRFVFFAGPAPGTSHTERCPVRWPVGGAGCLADAGGFIAYAGTPASMRLVQEALAGFRSAADVPPRGLAAPAYVRGVTLSDHHAPGHAGAVAVMLTDTGFMRYPYHDTAHGEDGDEDETAASPPADEFDDAGVARVVAALARTIAALAQNRRG